MNFFYALSLFLVIQTSSGSTERSRKLRSRDDDDERGDGEFRIVGGTNAANGEFPYMVKGGGCGGSLITPNLVLTAAHCDGAFKNRELRIGSIDRNSGGEIAMGVKEIPHPNYKGSNNDFMVVTLDREVQKTPIPLNSNVNSPSVGEQLTVIGFGRTSEGGSSSNRLKKVNVPTVSFQDCRGVYGSTIQDATMLCAG